MNLGLFGGWAGMAGALIEAVVFYSYAVLLLRLAGKTTVGTARIFDFVSTVAMGTMVGSTIISKSIALTTGLAGLTALVALQWAVAYASSRNPLASTGSPPTRPACSTTGRASSRRT